MVRSGVVNIFARCCSFTSHIIPKFRSCCVRLSRPNYISRFHFHFPLHNSIFTEVCSSTWWWTDSRIPCVPNLISILSRNGLLHSELLLQNLPSLEGCESVPSFYSWSSTVSLQVNRYMNKLKQWPSTRWGVWITVWNWADLECSLKPVDDGYWYAWWLFAPSSNFSLLLRLYKML